MKLVAYRLQSTFCLLVKEKRFCSIGYSGLAVSMLDRVKAHVRNQDHESLMADMRSAVIQNKKWCYDIKSLIMYTNSLCMTENRDRAEHLLACDVFELLNRSHPDVGHLGYLSLFDICLSRDMLKEAVDVFHRIMKFGVDIDLQKMERFIRMLSVEYHINLLIAVEPHLKVVSTRMLEKVAVPLLETGNINAFTKYFEKYMKNQNKDMCTILLAMSYGRLNRWKSLSFCKEYEKKSMNLIIDEIGKLFHPSKTTTNDDTSSTDNTKKFVIEKMLFSFFCEIEKTIQDRNSLSVISEDQLSSILNILSLDHMKSKYVIEDRDLVDHPDLIINDFATGLQSVSKRATLIAVKSDIFSNILSSTNEQIKVDEIDFWNDFNGKNIDNMNERDNIALDWMNIHSEATALLNSLRVLSTQQQQQERRKENDSSAYFHDENSNDDDMDHNHNNLDDSNHMQEADELTDLVNIRIDINPNAIGIIQTVGFQDDDDDEDDYEDDDDEDEDGDEGDEEEDEEGYEDDEDDESTFDFVEPDDAQSRDAFKDITSHLSSLKPPHSIGYIRSFFSVEPNPHFRISQNRSFKNFNQLPPSPVPDDDGNFGGGLSQSHLVTSYSVEKDREEDGVK